MNGIINIRMEVNLNKSSWTRDKVEHLDYLLSKNEIWPLGIKNTGNSRHLHLLNPKTSTIIQQYGGFI